MSRSFRPISFLLVGLVSLALAGCGVSEGDPRTEAQLVRVTTASDAGQVQRAFSGVVSARVLSNLGFRVNGKIVERLVDTGQAVTLGQPLMRIDRTDLALVTASQAAAVAAARAQSIQAIADEKRYRKLLADGWVSVAAYDKAKAAADAARAQLKVAEAQADVARNEANYSLLVADADGVVVETLAEPGQVVAAGETVVRLAHSGPREAVIHLPETVRPPIGSTARAVLFNSNVVGTARLRQLSNAADPVTRTFEARYVMEGVAGDAPLGSTVTIELADARAVNEMHIPLAALYDNGKGPGVWIVQGNEPRVIWRPVQLAGLGNETATITGGLQRGERFVALGAHLLHQDERVRVAPAQGDNQ